MLRACELENFHSHGDAPKGRGGEWWEQCDHVVLVAAQGYNTVDVRDVVDVEEEMEPPDVIAAPEPPSVDPADMDVSVAPAVTSDAEKINEAIESLMKITACSDKTLVGEIYSRCVGSEGERLNKAYELIMEEELTRSLIKSESLAGGSGEVVKRKLRSSGPLQTGSSQGGGDGVETPPKRQKSRK